LPIGQDRKQVALYNVMPASRDHVGDGPGNDATLVLALHLDTLKEECSPRDKRTKDQQDQFTGSS